MLKSLLALTRLSLITAMQYRGNFWLELCASAIQTISAVVPLLIVYQFTDEIVGWSKNELFVVLSLFFLITAFNKCFMEPNLGEMVESVRQGTFDLFLMKPVDAQLLASLRRFELSGLWYIFGGIGLMAYALSQLPTPSILDTALSLLCFISGLACLYSLWLMALCSSFFFVKVDNLRVLLWTLSDTGRWPIDVFSGWLKWFLLTAIPIGLMTSIPAQCLLHKWTVSTVTLNLCLGLFFICLSRWCWLWSLKHYSSASS